eukprot:4988980-Amphidinium_carterae.1
MSELQDAHDYVHPFTCCMECCQELVQAGRKGAPLDATFSLMVLQAEVSNIDCLLALGLSNARQEEAACAGRWHEQAAKDCQRTA